MRLTANAGELAAALALAELALDAGSSSRSWAACTSRPERTASCTLLSTPWIAPSP